MAATATGEQQGSPSNMTANGQARYNPWLHWFAILSALVTFLLLGLGGLVTSHSAGMSVPDWPNSYGYNMFFFPVSHWVGGILYEHSHRLLASFVGLLVVALTRWLGGRPACLPLTIVGVLEGVAGLIVSHLDPKWAAAGGFLLGIGGVVLLAGCIWAGNNPAPGPLPLLGWLVFASVQLQGLLGGLRVVLIDPKLGIVHAIIGQLFFVLMCTIALLTSRSWLQLADGRQLSGQLSGIAVGLRRLVLAATLLIFCQLVIGATMRQAHAGLSIPDFPLAYGKIWPSTTPAAILSYNAHRIQLDAVNPITAFQVILQMVHRLVALGIFILIAGSAWQARRRLGRKDALAKLAMFWLGLIVVQIFLGAATIWTNKAADVATAHMLGGALALVVGAMWCVVAFGRSREVLEMKPATISGPYGTAPAIAANN